MVGRVDALEVDRAVRHWKTSGLDLSALLRPAEKPLEFLGSYAIHQQDHQLEKALDNELIALALPAIRQGSKLYDEMLIVNTNRVVGAMLSNQIIREVGPQMLADDTLHFKFYGSAGQSFGCFLAKGVTLEVEGDANDFVGKGLSGGKIIVYPPKLSRFKAEDNILIGNVVLYGATSGECYFRGVAAERFCVRNSGASAVIEGVGDHGCEYMTGGRVVILGTTGRNFAAGMSGGVAYVWNPEQDFESRCNTEMVELESVVEEADLTELRQLIENHLRYTDSDVARRLLDNWNEQVGNFVKVMPTDYKRVLEARRSSVAAG
jgi:glutamate synthase (NADPH/NADH) large chain